LYIQFQEHDCKLTQEIIELIDREADLLMRGVKEANLEGLRKRISTLFLQYIKTPMFNPEVTNLLKVSQFLLGTKFVFQSKPVVSVQTLQVSFQDYQCRQDQRFTKKQDHITPVLKNLHWLPIRQRIDFKILLQCYKVVHEKGPEYLSLPRRTQTRKRRSSSSITLAPKRFKTNFGERGFAVGGGVAQ
jgi:hypothetical protein